MSKNFDLETLVEALTISIARALEDNIERQTLEDELKLQTKLEMLIKKAADDELSEELKDELDNFLDVYYDYRRRRDLLAYQAGVRVAAKMFNDFDKTPSSNKDYYGDGFVLK